MLATVAFMLFKASSKTLSPWGLFCVPPAEVVWLAHLPDVYSARLYEILS